MAAVASRADAQAPVAETRRIALSAITPVQMREQTNDRIVQQYAMDMARPSQVFPPIVVFYDGENYWLGDGMHRLLATQTLRSPDILARVLPGGECEAVEYAALEAPKDHSKVAYNEGDKQLRVKRMWEVHPEWHHGGASNRQIAESCGVDERTVRRARERFELTEVSAARAADTSTPPPDPPSVPLPPGVVTSERSNETAASAPPLSPQTPKQTPKRAVRVHRERAGKTQEYAMAVRQPDPEPEPDKDTDPNPNPFLGMKMNTVIHLMADFHNRVRAALGDDMPSDEILRTWWASVEPRDWQAFQEHFPWLRGFHTHVHKYLVDDHRWNGKTTTPPMVRELTPKSPKKPRTP